MSAVRATCGPQAVVAALLSLALALSGNAAVETVDQRDDSTFGHCIGDCGEDGRVTIDEIILDVRIALGEAAPDLCRVGGPGPGFGIDGLVTAVLNSLAGCTTVHDVSGFEEFTYALTPAFGFCPPLGAVHDAVIDRSGNTYLLKRSIVDTGTPGVDDCLPEYLTGSPCLVARAVPCRALTLTADEVQRVSAIFRQITVWTAADSFCLFGVDDPCLVRTARWDNLQTSNAICAASRIDYEQSDRIRALVESLGNGPEMACHGP